jgi:hypothetical protein
VIGDELYKTLVTGHLLRCISKAEVNELLIEIHSGVWGGHIASDALAAKVFRHGLFR